MTIASYAQPMPDQSEMPCARKEVFCASDAPEIFESVVRTPQIWEVNRFDVPSIHAEAREVFAKLLRRAAATPAPRTGRTLLLHGEAGSGKTHLLQAFRTFAHGEGIGYLGYLQMTTEASSYSRYILRNLIASLDEPYFPTRGATSGLMRLSTGLFDAIPGITAAEHETFRSLMLGQAPERVHDYADRLLSLDQFADCDIDLVRALIYLQRDEARVKSKVLKWLRCENLSSLDRATLGDLVPKDQDEHPLEMISQLARLMHSLHGSALVVCVDQLEDMASQEMAKERFCKVIDALVALADTVPTAVVVIACLEDYYTANRPHLSRAKLDRLENDPEPVRLHSQRGLGEIAAMVSRRLSFLYEDAGLESCEEGAVYPFELRHLEPLANLSARKVLDYCRKHHERCIAAGHWTQPPESGQSAGFGSPARNAINGVNHHPINGVAHADDSAPTSGNGHVEGPSQSSSESSALARFDHNWNDARLREVNVPDDEETLSSLLAWAIDQTNPELPDGFRYTSRIEGNRLPVQFQAAGQPEEKFIVAVCEKSASGGGLGRQVKDVERMANGYPVVLVRSTAFPQNLRSLISAQIGKVLGSKGRRVEVENSDWRTIINFRAFCDEQHDAEGFDVWQKAARPLSQLAAVRKVLDLDKLPPPRALPERPAPTPVSNGFLLPRPVMLSMPVPPPPILRPASSPHSSGSFSSDRSRRASSADAPTTGPLALGQSRGLGAAPVFIQPGELKQHMAIIGGSGSGKTTAALGLIEQLLLRGVPAILLDRKGDLARYADHDAWRPSSLDSAVLTRLRRLNSKVDVALFTPGASAGRPLSIPVVPEAIRQLPTIERQQITEFSSAALAAMMGYKPTRRSDQVLQLILAKAMEVMAQVSDRPITLDALREVIENQDEALMNALGGGYDAKEYRRLGQDLLTLRLQHSRLLAASAETLDIDVLLGRGLASVPGKTRLSIIHTGGLGSQVAVDFWVSQFFAAMDRWRVKSPSDELQAVLFIDEADQYLPAVRQPPTKAPLESLLRRARSAGLGIMLATQSPGDFDYKCKENIRAWLVGRVKESTSLAKLKPLFGDSRHDLVARLPTQQTGEFYLLRESESAAVNVYRSMIETRQLSSERIAELARAKR